MAQTYSIEKKMMLDTIFSGSYSIVIDGEPQGEITPVFKTVTSNTVVGYQTHIWLEHEALADDSGFPNEYRYLKEAKEAVVDLMERNGIDKATVH